MSAGAPRVSMFSPTQRPSGNHSPNLSPTPPPGDLDFSFCSPGKRPLFVYRPRTISWAKRRIAAAKFVEKKGHVVDALDALLSTLFLAVHIALTYRLPAPLQQWLWASEVAMASAFLLRMVVLSVLALESSAIHYHVKGSWVIDLLTIVPVIPFSFVSVPHHLRPGEHHILNMVNPFKVVRAYYAMDRYLSGMDNITILTRQVVHCFIRRTSAGPAET